MINKEENDFKKIFIEIFDHIIWYIIFIVFMLCVAYSSAHGEKQIKLTGSIKCSELIDK